MSIKSRWDKSPLKIAISEGLMITGVVALTMSLLNSADLSSQLLFSTFGVISLAAYAYELIHRKTA